MTARQRQFLWTMLAVGGAARVVLAFATVGVGPDIGSYRLVAHELRHLGVHAYSGLQPSFGFYPWPYPPGFFPAVLAADGLHRLTGLPFHGLIQLPAIAADLGIAWLVQLQLAGTDPRKRLAAAGLIAAGPTFLMVSGYHGQFDSVAVLPALGALVVWTRLGARRAVVAGLLIGLAGTFKQPLLISALAFLPSCRTRREAATLLSCAAAVPVAALLPFWLAEPSKTLHVLHYHGLLGLGGVSLIAEPGLLNGWLLHAPYTLAWPETILARHGAALNVVWVAAAAAILLRLRPRAAQALVVIWLALYCLAPAFAPWYLVWGLTFVIAAGHLRAAGLIQAAALVPMILFYGAPWSAHWLVPLYATLMIALWAALCIWLALLVRSRAPTPAPA